MADARNYRQYRREVLDKLGVEYYDEDIQEFDKWRLKVLSGLKDLFTEENIIRAVEEWLDEHTVVFDGATDRAEAEAGLVPPTTLGAKRQARAHYHLNAEGDWVVDPVWNAYGSGYGGTEKITIKYPNSTGTAGVNIEAIGTGQKGTANGVATLGADGKVPSEQMRDIPLADRSTIGGIKIETGGEPPRPSARLTTNWTPSYPNVSDVKFPLIRDDGTISAYFMPEATQSVKGAMSASDKAKLDSLAEGYDFETTLTPTINSNGAVPQHYKIVPKDLTNITLKNALKISAYLCITGNYYEEAIPLIVTACRSSLGVGYTLSVKCIISSPQATGNTVSGKLHIVAPFEIDSVTVTR